MMLSAVGALPPSEQQLPNGVLQAHGIVKKTVCPAVSRGQAQLSHQQLCTTIDKMCMRYITPNKIHDKVA